MSLIAKVQSYYREVARAEAESVAAPPFTLFLHATDHSQAANFAIPDVPIQGQSYDAIRATELRGAEYKCRVHFRFLHAYAPELTASLEACDYYEANQVPLLICTPKSYQDAPSVAGLEIVTISNVSSLEIVQEGLNANALGYDPNAALATDAEAESFRKSLQNCRAFAARLHGQAVGAGMFNPIREKVTELVGITTLAPFRRRGIATYLTAYATRMAFTLGAELTFLVPENVEAMRVYERVGYSLYTALLVYHPKDSAP